jgi:hypothetical protein
MSIRRTLIPMIMSTGVLGGAADPAAASQILYDSVGFMVGQQSFSDTFSVGGPGTLTVSLTDIAWPDQLASLNMVVSTPKGLLGPEVGAGTESYSLNGGPVTVQWFGTAQGPLDAGVYGMNIQFQSNGTTSVPLPTSIALFLSGIGLLAWQRRSRRASEFEHGEGEFDPVS